MRAMAQQAEYQRQKAASNPLFANTSSMSTPPEEPEVTIGAFVDPYIGQPTQSSKLQYIRTLTPIGSIGTGGSNTFTR